MNADKMLAFNRRLSASICGWIISGAFHRPLLLAALLVCGAASAQDRPPAQDLIDRGIALARAGQPDAAERLLLEGRSRFPADPRFDQELAGLAFRRNDLPAARSWLRRALRIAPSDAYANDFLGSLNLLDGNLPAALKRWTRIQKPWIASLRFDPDPPLAPLLRARNFEISAGQVFTYDRLLRTESRLALLGVFSDCRFSLAPGADTGYDLTIRALPLAPPLRGWPGVALAASSGLPYREVLPEFYNVGRHAINIRTLWRWDPEKRRIALDLSGPVHFWRYDIAFDARDENWDIDGARFKLRRIEAAAGLARDLSGRLTWTVGLAATARQFRGASGQFFSNGWIGELRNRMDYLLLDQPERRLRIDAWGALRTGTVFSRAASRLVAPESGLRARWTPDARHTITVESRAGALFGEAPLDELYILGMERDNDLWLRGHVGTRDGRKGSAPMGRQYILNRVDAEREVLRLAFVRIQAGPFLDAGRIGGSGALGSRGWLFDTGVQARVAAGGGFQWLAVYGRNLRDGTGVFYTAIRR